MSFNPDTCEVIRITNKKRIIELCTLMEEEEELGHFVPSKICVEYHIYVFIGMGKKEIKIVIPFAIIAVFLI